jgi:hypothetical protein
MTTIQLDDAVAAALAAKAAASGLSVEAFIRLSLLPEPSQAPRMSGEELERMLTDLATAGASPKGTFPRSEIYSDHD